MTTDPALMLAALRRQMAQLDLVNKNIHNLAQSIFMAGVTVQYVINKREQFGRVVDVAGEPVWCRSGDDGKETSR